VYTLKDLQTHLFDRYGACIVGSIPNGFVYGFDGIPSGSIDIDGEVYYLTSPKLAKKFIALNQDWEKCVRQLTKKVICPVSLDEMYDTLSTIMPAVLNVSRGYIQDWVPVFHMDERFHLFELASSLRNGEIISALPDNLTDWFERIKRDVDHNEVQRSEQEAIRNAFKRSILVEEALFESRLPVFLRHIEIDFESRTWKVGKPSLFERIANINEFPHIAASAKLKRSTFQEDLSNVISYKNGEARYLHIRFSRPHLLTSVDAFLFPEDPRLLPEF
jgi:hypothetical protein